VGGLVGGLVFGLVTGLGVRAVAPRSMTIRRPTRRDLGRGHWAGLRIGLWVGLLVGLVVGLTEGLSYWGSYGLLVWLVYGLWPGLVHGLVFALVAWLVFALVAWLVDVWRTPLVATLDATPRSVYQRDVRSQLVGGLMGVLACLLGFGLLWPLLEFGVAATGLTMAQYEGLDFYELLEALPVALAVGLVFGPLVGLLFVLKGGAAPSLVLAEIALLLKGRRVRFMPMLETALARQVLRQAGAVYQFRHADLQDRLADQYQARPTRHRPA